MHPQLFQFFFQDCHFGLHWVAALKQLLVVPPYTTEGNVALQPGHSFILLILEVKQHTVVRMPKKIQAESDVIIAGV